MTSNWKNVNNWHWVEKNCFPWAKDYFTKKLESIHFEDNDCSICCSLVDLKGDVDLNQRKGKLLTLFDLEMEIGFEVKKNNSTNVQKMIIPELAHDTLEKEIVVSIYLM
jgi:activator of HSP90 ATPase